MYFLRDPGTGRKRYSRKVQGHTYTVHTFKEGKDKVVTDKTNVTKENEEKMKVTTSLVGKPYIYITYGFRV